MLHIDLKEPLQISNPKINTNFDDLESTKQDKIQVVGILKGDGEGGVTAAEAGTDYATRAQVTAKQDTIQVQGLLKGLGTGTVSAAAAGVDYMAPDAIVVPEAFDEVNLVFYSNADSAEGQVGDTATYANIQIETGNTRTAFDAFASAEYALPTLEPLYSLPDGVCDTFEAATGTETRRIGVIDSYSSQTVGDNWISSTGALTEGAQVIYELEAPVITRHDPIAVTVPAATANIYADEGEVNITYTKDTGRVIAALTERIAALEGGNNA